jgi:Glucodextranase, domain B
VSSSRLRCALSMSALAVLAFALAPASAEAIEAITATQITSPANASTIFFDENEKAPNARLFTVEGTVTGATTGEVDVRCYKALAGSFLLGEAVPVSSGGFSLALTGAMVDQIYAPCVLRAVPSGDETDYPPEAASSYEGPQIALPFFEFFEPLAEEDHYDYELNASDLSGDFEIESVGDCAITYSALFAPETLAGEANGLFDCAGVLYAGDEATGTRSELRVDGANAYGPASAHALESYIIKAPVAHAPQIAVSDSFERANDEMAVSEVDPIVSCAPEPQVWPPTPTSCKEFVSTGVELQRSWRTSEHEHVARMTDTWRSTDNQGHTINALYDQETIDGPSGGAYAFPGRSAFAPTSEGEAISLPQGPGAILYKEDASTPEEGDGVHPQGAIIYEAQPDEPVQIYRGSEESLYNGFEMPYERTIPAGGTSTLGMTFVQGYSQAEVVVFAIEALIGYLPEPVPPTLTINSPPDGAVVSSPSLVVSGSATAPEPLTSLTVAGKVVKVGANGEWSTTVTLSPGLNVIGVIAKDEAGSTSKTIHVTYSPPNPAPPAATSAQIGSAHTGTHSVSFTISCHGPAESSCEIASSLTTMEKTKGGKPIAVSAKRRRRVKTTSKEVSVGSSKISMSTGQQLTITLELNALGKRLLAKFGKLPAHLTVSQLANGQRSTIISENLTIKGSKRRKRRHKAAKHRRR